MIAINWGSREGRIWLADLPAWKYESSQVVERHQDVSELKWTTKRACAIELLVPTGPRAHYGGLGAIFVPENTGRLTIQVPISPDNGPMLRESLAGTLDRVHVGLPAYYTDGFLERITQEGTAQMLGSGTLRFCCATHGEIGSSRWFFTILGRLVLKLLTLEWASLSEQQLITLIQDEINHAP